MKRWGLVVLVFLFLGCGFAYGQFRAAANSNRSGQRGDDQGPLSKFYFAVGGGFGAGTSGYGRYTYYSLLPVVGYKISPQFIAGASFTYQHQGYPDIEQSFSQYGAGPFLRYNFNQLFFQIENDYISSPTITSTAYGSALENSKFFSRLLFGVGYSQPVGAGRSALNAMVMYDALYRTPSVFNSPIVVRVFFSF